MLNDKSRIPFAITAAISAVAVLGYCFSDVPGFSAAYTAGPDGSVAGEVRPAAPPRLVPGVIG